MEKKLSRKEQAAQTKEHIFEVAVAMLNDRPFEEIKIRDIVKQAGVSTGSFYNYYKTKLDVYYESYVLCDEYFDTVVRRSLAKVKGSEAKLRKFFRSMGEYNAKHIRLTKILYNSDNKCFKMITPHGVYSQLLEIVEEGIEKGELKGAKSANEIARYLMVAMRGQAYDWCISDGSYDLPSAMDSFIEKVLKAYQ